MRLDHALIRLEAQLRTAQSTRPSPPILCSIGLVAVVGSIASAIHARQIEVTETASSLDLIDAIIALTERIMLAHHGRVAHQERGYLEALSAHRCLTAARFLIERTESA